MTSSLLTRRYKQEDGGIPQKRNPPGKNKYAMNPSIATQTQLSEWIKPITAKTLSSRLKKWESWPKEMHLSSHVRIQIYPNPPQTLFQCNHKKLRLSKMRSQMTISMTSLKTYSLLQHPAIVPKDLISNPPQFLTIQKAKDSYLPLRPRPKRNSTRARSESSPKSCMSKRGPANSRGKSSAAPLANKLHCPRQKLSRQVSQKTTIQLTQRPIIL